METVQYGRRYGRLVFEALLVNDQGAAGYAAAARAVIEAYEHDRGEAIADALGAMCGNAHDERRDPFDPTLATVRVFIDDIERLRAAIFAQEQEDATDATD